MSLTSESYNEEDVQRLGDTLDGIDLQAGERAALEALIRFASRKPSEIEALADRTHGHLKTVLTKILFDSESS